MAKPGEMGIINMLWRCQVWPQPLQHLPPSSPQSLSLPQGHMKGSLCPDDSACPPCAVPACRVMNKGPANPLPHPWCCFPRLWGAARCGRSCPHCPGQLPTPGVPSAPHLRVLTVAVPHGSLPSPLTDSHPTQTPLSSMFSCCWCFSCLPAPSCLAAHSNLHTDPRSLPQLPAFITCRSQPPPGSVHETSPP